jgi:hypothetical protein
MNKTAFPCGFTRCPIYHLYNVIFVNVVHVIEQGFVRSFCYFCHLVTTRVVVVPFNTTFYETWSIT